MRPLKLTMTAFGPYAEVEVIDFTQLEGRNIFLITGPTGAGKTTIFDGISYAIYGEASGQERDGENLRSQFADLDTLTMVELEFQLRGRHYYIKRIPRQEKRRTRGEGTTEQSPEAELRILGEEEPQTVTGISNVREKIHQLMGITSEQFRQIMMIPQGEFRKLLTSDSKDREKILQKIFGTEDFKLVETKLNDMARTIRLEISSLVTRRQDNLIRVELKDPQLMQQFLEGKDLNYIEILTILKEEIHQDEIQQREMANAIKQQDQQLEESHRRILKAEENNKKIILRDELVKEKQKLEDEKEKMTGEERKLQLARRAEGIVPIEENYAEKQQDVAIKELELEAKVKQLKELEFLYNKAENQLQQEQKRENQGESLSEELTILKGFQEKVNSFEGKKKNLHQLDINLKKVEKDRDDKRKEVEELKERNKELTVKLEKFKNISTDLLEAKTELEKVLKTHDKLKRLDGENDKLDELINSYKQIKKQHEDRTDQYLRAKEDYEKLLETWYRGQAGILAQDLKKDGECPVCGSTHHPHPARLEEGIPTEATLKQDKEKLVNMDKSHQESQIKVNGAESQGKSQKAIVGRMKEELEELIDTPLQELKFNELKSFIKDQLIKMTSEKAAFEKKVDSLEKHKIIVEEMTKKQTDLTKILGEEEKKLEIIIMEYTQVASSFQGEKSLVEALEKELPEEIRSPEKLQVSIKQKNIKLQEIKDAYKKAEVLYRDTLMQMEKTKTQLVEINKNLIEIKNALETAREKFIKSLEIAGFEDYEDYGRAKLNFQGIQQLEEELKKFNETLKSVQDRYVEAQVLANGLEFMEIKELEEQYSIVKEKKEQMEDIRRTLHTKIDRNKEAMITMEELQDKIGGKEEEYRLVGHMAEVAKGNNVERMTFERYVLASFLDNILEAANVRLVKMTGNRYELSRTDERARSNAQSGLELEVYDHYTGKSRHVKTLSGGEGFKASLSLALGLADVVQSYAGGISIDTIFIDEGFGTLDTESLDSAVETLVELQNTGRLVGIISHVPELKERIGAKLEIVPKNRGSKAIFRIV